MQPTRGPGPRQAAVAIATVLALIASACAGDDRDVRILSAASLGPVARDLAAAGPVPAVVSDGGSQVLAAQVRAGAPVDVLLLADPAIAAALAAEGLAGEPVPVATTGLAVIVARGAPVDGIEDLADGGLRVVVADEGVPLGDYTRAGLRALEDRGLVAVGTAQAILDGVDSLEEDARQVVAKVTSGEADAAVVYATDAARVGDLRSLPWPSAADQRATYTAQVVGDDGRADQFIAWLQSDEAVAILAAAGFGPPGAA